MILRHSIVYHSFCIRSFHNVSRLHASKKYANTLNLPKTTFQLTMKDGMAIKRELQIQKTAAFQELYNWQWQDAERKATFVLHDGPPYANGNPHVGHALNKILKDIINRYKVLQGYQVHYIPGWDCHGLPIEQKALADIKADHRLLEPIHIRKTAAKFAQKTIKNQLSAFKRWGVMADWQGGCYRTVDKTYEANQLEVFFQMYDKGLIYQDFMPVYWSPSSRTALAEAELEYRDDHISTSVYVKFPLTKLPQGLLTYLGESQKKVNVLIWTTTPWTLPANQAICYGREIQYCFVESSDQIYLVCSSFVEKLAHILGHELSTIASFDGGCLEGCRYVHPLRREELPLLPAGHVTTEKGTGLVHTAPAHGPEDFQVAVNHRISPLCLVNEEGEYTDEAGPQLSGKAVLDAGNEAVLTLMGECIVRQESFEHSYPYDWRSKQPVILRASKQWFVDTSQIKDQALAELEKVSILPKASGQGMLSQLGLRTYWCISRQRVWGVPIPVFHEKGSGKLLLTRSSVDHLKSLVEQHGTDCWWTLPLDQLLPPHVKQQSGFAPDAVFTSGTDVLDIWFDSGVSWATVLKDFDGVSDVYVEGVDQFGGWFQSSLLTSVATRDKAPYRKLVVHGFAMDEEGKKMSKSLGNVVDPDVVINGGKDRKLDPAYGADTLRLWAAQAGLETKVSIGTSTLNRCHETIFQMRKSLRYLLGNLSDYQPDINEVPYSNMLLQDQYMLHLLHGFAHQITNSYEKFHFSKVPNAVEKFLNTDLASFLHLSKDRMYCSYYNDLGRRSGQTVQYHVLRALTRFLAPVLPHLAEEVFSHGPHGQHAESVFHTGWFEPQPEWLRPDLVRPFDLVSSIRDTVNVSIGNGQPETLDVVVCAKNLLFTELKKLQVEMTSSLSPLSEMLQCSSSSVLSRPPLVIPDEAQPVEGTWTPCDGEGEKHAYLLVIMPAEDFQCERCRRYTAQRYGQPCPRCVEVMSEGWES